MKILRITQPLKAITALVLIAILVSTGFYLYQSNKSMDEIYEDPLFNITIGNPEMFTFETPWNFSPGMVQVLIDFDSDNDLDLVMTQFHPPHRPANISIEIWDRSLLAFRNEGGLFTNATNEVFNFTRIELIHPRHWAVADLNGDGRDDLFIADPGPDEPPHIGGQSVILIQNENGQLIDETSTRIPQILAFTHYVSIGDIDNDNDNDIYMCNIANNGSVGPRFYINDGDGFFSSEINRIPSSITNLNKKFTSSLLLDIDKDDDLDLVLGSHDNPSPYDTILINDGSGNFNYNTVTLPNREGGETVAIITGDFNNDDWPDLLMSTHLHYGNPKLQLLTNNKDGSFTDESTRIEQIWEPVDHQFSWDLWIAFIQVVDIDKNGFDDFLVNHGGNLRLGLYASISEHDIKLIENFTDFYEDESFPTSILAGNLDANENLDFILIYPGSLQKVLLR